jgi:hypothetical protein
LLRAFQRSLYLLFPIAVSLAVFHEGFGAWFQQDDFAHLKLAAQTSLADLPGFLITPIAQGTFRPLSERLFYWFSYRAFGLDALPLRVLAAVLQSLNTALLAYLLLRLTGSRLAACAGALLWATSPNLTITWTWIATTNQALWTLCVLATILCFLQYAEQGSGRFLIAAWVFYLAGFGMLESNVAVPAVLTLYAWLFHRNRVRHTLLFWIPAVVFAAAHLLLIPKTGAASYGMHFGAGIVGAIVTYWQWSWSCDRAVLAGYPAWPGIVSVLLFTSISAALLIRGETRPQTLFALGTWLLLLGPVLPLSRHISDYYLTAPWIGLAVLTAVLVKHVRLAASIPAAVCAGMFIPISLNYAHDNVRKSLNIEALVRGVEQAARLHPGKTILLAGVNDDLFWSGVYDRPFSLVTSTTVALTPEAAASLAAYNELFQAESYTLPETTAAALLDHESAVVYRWQNRRLVNLTDSYRKLTGTAGRGRKPSKIELGNPAYAPLIGKDWHEQEDGFRWMPASASLRMGRAGNELLIRGFCAPEQLKSTGSVRVSAFYDALALGDREIRSCSQDFELRFPIPASAAAEGEVKIRVYPTLRLPSDTRELGLAVNAVEIR